MKNQEIKQVVCGEDHTLIYKNNGYGEVDANATCNSNIILYSNFVRRQQLFGPFWF